MGDFQTRLDHSANVQVCRPGAAIFDTFQNIQRIDKYVWLRDSLSRWQKWHLFSDGGSSLNSDISAYHAECWNSQGCYKKIFIFWRIFLILIINIRRYKKTFRKYKKIYVGSTGLPVPVVVRSAHASPSCAPRTRALVSCFARRAIFFWGGLQLVVGGLQDY